MQCRPYITAAAARCRTSRTPTTTEQTRARAHRSTLLFTNAAATCVSVVLCCDRRRDSRRHVPEPAREEALDVPPGAGQVPLPGRRQEGQQVRQPGLVQLVHLVEGLDGGQEEAGAGGQVGDALWRRERAAAPRCQRPSRRSRSPGAATVQMHCFETPGRHCHLTIRKAIPKDADDDGVCRSRDNVRCGQR